MIIDKGDERAERKLLRQSLDNFIWTLCFKIFYIRCIFNDNNKLTLVLYADIIISYLDVSCVLCRIGLRSSL